jgi:hypothetical protein
LHRRPQPSSPYHTTAYAGFNLFSTCILSQWFHLLSIAIAQVLCERACTLTSESQNGITPCLSPKPAKKGDATALLLSATCSGSQNAQKLSMRCLPRVHVHCLATQRQTLWLQSCCQSIQATWSWLGPKTQSLHEGQQSAQCNIIKQDSIVLHAYSASCVQQACKSNTTQTALQT